MLRRITKRLSRNERGAAAVEMALVLPLLFLLGFGAVELARTIWQYQIVTKGVRDGVRYLTRVPVTCAAVGPGGTFSAADIEAAKNLVKSGTKTASTPIVPTYASAVFQITVDCRDAAALGLNGGAYMPVVRMTVQYPFQEWFASLLGLSDLTFNITHEQVHVGE
jgi:Flp pilus assembly protein TadG